MWTACSQKRQVVSRVSRKKGLSRDPGAHTTPVHPDGRLGAMGFKLCPTGYWSRVNLILPFYFPTPTFRSGNIYPVPRCHGRMNFIFNVFRASQLTRPSLRELWAWDFEPCWNCSDFGDALNAFFTMRCTQVFGAKGTECPLNPCAEGLASCLAEQGDGEPIRGGSHGRKLSHWACP